MTPEERSARAKIAATAGGKKRTAERLERERQAKKRKRTELARAKVCMVERAPHRVRVMRAGSVDL